MTDKIIKWFLLSVMAFIIVSANINMIINSNILSIISGIATDVYFVVAILFSIITNDVKKNEDVNNINN